MTGNKIVFGQIDTGVHPDLDYLSGLTIRLTTLDQDGNPHFDAKAYKGNTHGSQLASIICGPFYADDLPPVTAIEAIAIPPRGKIMLCLLRALDAMLRADIRVLCLPVGINLPTPVFLPFLKAFTAQGVLVVAPSGNKGKGIIMAPGCYPEVLTVGALTRHGTIANYSGRKAEESGLNRKPDVYARGEFPDPAAPDSGKIIRGTSMACAWVAGKAARIWYAFPNTTLADMRAKLGAAPSTAGKSPPFVTVRYIDSRLKTSLRLYKENDRFEGIIISGNPSTAGVEAYPITRLLTEVEAIAGCAPDEVRTFRVDDVIHLIASSRFFQTLLQHQGLFCAQPVDVSIFDM